MRERLAAILVGSLVVADCGAAHDPSGSPVPARNRPVQAAVADLAARLHINRARVRVIAVEPRTWRDGCLGLPSPELCPHQRTPGYRLILAAEGHRHVYHTDRDETVRYGGDIHGP